MKTLFATKDQLESIAEKYPTPFYLYDEKGMRENARALRAAFAWNPGFKEYFAVKATPTPGILQVFKEEGCGLDCSSLTELMLARATGFSGDDIMFSSNVTPPEDYQLAAELGAIINLDDITHIDFVEGLVGIPQTVCCRFNPGGHFGVDENEIMDAPRDAKYGMTREQIFEAVKTLADKGVQHFGLHAFLASNTTSDRYFAALSAILFELAVELKRAFGVHVAFINLSGGVGIPYLPDEKPADIAVIGDSVRQVYEQILSPAGMDDVKLFTELGRFMTGPFGCLCARAIHKKQIHKEYIGLDACAANLMRPAMYGAYHHITIPGKEHLPCDCVVDVTGGLCENNDKFAIDRALPPVEIGDLVVLHDTGAHGHAMGYNYNGKLRSSELLLREDGSVAMLRRAETPEDYFATFDFLGLKF